MTCRHRMCTCPVTGSEPFCGDFCRMQPDDESLVIPDGPYAGGEVADCGCGHSACSVAPVPVD